MSLVTRKVGLYMSWQQCAPHNLWNLPAGL